jgi:hypothetical protein
MSILNNPRNKDNNLGTMVCWNSRFDLGDYEYTKEAFPTKQDFDNWLSNYKGKVTILPLFIYEENGIHISVASGLLPTKYEQVGYIFATFEKIKEISGGERVSRKREQKTWMELTKEVEEYHTYLDAKNFIYNSLVKLNEVS